jgi:uncharacterized membrane protein
VSISWRTNFWLIPSLTVIGALAVFAIGQRLDWEQHTGALPLPKWLDQGSAADARSVLAATAGAIITTLGLVLSITVLTLSVAASQFGQRLLRRYIRDRGTQVCIGIFAATFVFSLLTLLSVTSRPHEKEYVPWLSIWISTALALTCIGILIYYINHVAHSIQVDTVLAELSNDFRWAMNENRGISVVSGESMPEVHPDLALPAPVAGYVQSIDYEALFLRAIEADAIIRLLFRPGQFVVHGVILAVAEGPNVSDRRLGDTMRQAIRIGARRTLRQDPEFAMAQIVEIALRAMSPGINDPNTAVTCVNWLAECLRSLAQSPFRNPIHADRNGKVRLIEEVNRFERIVSTAYDPIRPVARNSTTLTIGMLNSMSLIAPFVQTEFAKEALNDQASLAFEGLFSDALSKDREDVAAAYHRFVHALYAQEKPKATRVPESQLS